MTHQLLRSNWPGRAEEASAVVAKSRYRPYSSAASSIQAGRGSPGARISTVPGGPARGVGRRGS